jgi:hypothetical protein
MKGYTPEYIRHCIRYAPEIAKLDVLYLPETFVALECNVGPWAAFRYYDLITESHYRLLAGKRAHEEKLQPLVSDWGKLGFPTLTKIGYQRFKIRRAMISEMLGDGGDPNERNREHKAEAFLTLSKHLVQSCRADIESRKRWHYNIFQWAIQIKIHYRGERLSKQQSLYRKQLFLSSINAGDGPDGIAAGAIGRWCIGAPGPERHGPCILCAYPLPFTLVDSGPKHYWYGSAEGRGSGGEARPSGSSSGV